MSVSPGALWATLALHFGVGTIGWADDPGPPTPPTPAKQSPGDYLPARFELYIHGGIFPPSYSVKVQGESLVYSAREAVPGSYALRERSEVIRPTAERWRRFWKAMDEVGLWDWRPEYPNPRVADGTRWGLEIAFGGREIRSSGSNGYPGGPADSPEPSRVFEAYRKAVEDLLGGESFR